jgi:hypothetical protein
MRTKADSEVVLDDAVVEHTRLGGTIQSDCGVPPLEQEEKSITYAQILSKSEWAVLIEQVG